MAKVLLHEKIAVLVANGFHEIEMTAAQKLLQKEGAYTRIISMDHGLVNSWTGTSWGHHFAADCVLNTALAVDFSMLLIPGGRRSVEKLKLTAHTQRFINGFLNTGKPLAVMGDAVELLMLTNNLAGKTICGPEYLENDMKAAGSNWQKQAFAIDQNLMTCDSTREALDQAIPAIVDHFRSFARTALQKAA